MSIANPFSDILNCILQTGHHLKSITSSPCLLEPSPSPTTATIPVTLPDPPSLLPELVSTGLDLPLAEEISRTYLQHATEFKRQSEASLAQTYADMGRLPRTRDSVPIAKLQDAVTSAFSGLYLRKLQGWVQEGIVVAKSQVNVRRNEAPPSRRDIAHSKIRSSFNPEYSPLLQHFFDENAFPSHADKVFLAKKSGMEYKQIHVWFQNHRSRARKEGRTLRKKPLREAPMSSFDELFRRMGDRVIPEEERKEYVDSEASEYEWQYDSSDVESPVKSTPLREPHACDALDTEAPSHAFPMVYPPPGHLKPFPIKDGIHNLSAPVWRRSPAQAPVEHAHVDLQEFIKEFANLNIRDGPRKHWVKRQPADLRKRSGPKRTSSLLSKPDRSAATSAITTKLPPAPLPALIPIVPATSLRMVVPKIRAVPAPPSRRHVFKSPSPRSLPSTLLLPEQTTPFRSRTPGCRKVAPLPRRTPISAKLEHRRVTHVDSEIAISSHSPPITSYSHSRASSFSSESSQPRSFSDASSASSEVVTPDSMPVLLPDDSQITSLSFLASGFKPSSNLVDLDCHAAQRDFSLVEILPSGLQLDFSAAVGARKAQHFDFMLSASPPAPFSQTVS